MILSIGSITAPAVQSLPPPEASTQSGPEFVILYSPRRTLTLEKTIYQTLGCKTGAHLYHKRNEVRLVFDNERLLMR